MVNVQTLVKMAVFISLVLISVTNVQAVTDLSKIVEIKVMEIAGTSRTNVFQTFGHVFRKGDVPASANLEATLIDGSSVPLQVNIKSTHGDGSLRHAILSIKLPSVLSGKTQNVILKTGQTSVTGNNLKIADLMTSGLTSSVNIVLGGKNYSATLADGIAQGSVQNWLEGPLASEWLVRSELKDDLGIAHPHITARFNVRTYDGFPNAKLDIIVENNWSFVPDPQNFTYDVTINVAGQSVFNKTALKQYHHTRWKKTFWFKGDSGLDVIYDKNYLMQTRALPNYDLSIQVSEATLANLKNDFDSSNTEPMGLSVISSDMPGTGARSDIGPLPKWSVLYILSMDKRAKDGVMTLGDSGGSWSIHYRDRNTDMPASLLDYPYMTISDSKPATLNPNTGKYEVFASCGGDCNDPYSPDNSHQPSFAYLPYLITGDHFYLEELMFWNNYNLMFPGPQYRQFGDGILQWDQVRGQAWSLRTLGQLAYIMPDAHRLKSHYVGVVNKNLDWYNAKYTNNVNANKLGILTVSYAFPYDNERSASSWMDDFFTWSIGYLKALDFEKAGPLLEWKAISSIERMTNSGYCWLIGAPYGLTVRDGPNSPIYDNYAQVYAASVAVNFSSISGLACDSPEMNNALELKAGEMWGYADETTGYPSNLQPALAVVTETVNPKAASAWQVFNNRAVKPDYSLEPQFAIVPFGSGGTIVDTVPGQVDGVSLSVTR